MSRSKQSQLFFKRRRGVNFQLAISSEGAFCGLLSLLKWFPLRKVVCFYRFHHYAALYCVGVLEWKLVLAHTVVWKWSRSFPCMRSRRRCIRHMEGSVHGYTVQPINPFFHTLILRYTHAAKRNQWYIWKQNLGTWRTFVASIWQVVSPSVKLT